MGLTKKTTRFSGADWADEIKNITLIGVGGIGSWVAVNLGRIGHIVNMWDGDTVDETNVIGGQMYRRRDIGKRKVTAIYEICRDLGVVSAIVPTPYMFTAEDEMHSICITGLDNMEARKIAFEMWVKDYSGDPNALFIDGRLLMENMEIFAIKGTDLPSMSKYKNEFLFNDTDVPDLDCTTKQTTFASMIIAGLITATLCNFLTNLKLGVELRDVPFHQKLLLPFLKYDIEAAAPIPAPVEITVQEPVNEIS